MMMNEFGTPMSDAEMTMRPTKPHEQMMAQSGVENGIVGSLIGAGIGLVGSVIGGNKAADAAEDQVDAQNDAKKIQHAYDKLVYQANKDKIDADHLFATETYDTNVINDKAIVAYKDQVNIDRYNYDLQIRDREQDSLDAQFRRSGSIYDSQTSLNAMSAEVAVNDEIRKLQEIGAEAAFDKQEEQMKLLVAQGKARARGQSGRSAEKVDQSSLAGYGRTIAMMNEGLAASGRNSKSALTKISMDKASADLSAWAQKMLDPGVLPDPIEPIATPMTTYQPPRAIGEFDYGPEPVLGGLMSPSAAANQVWGSTIANIGSSLGSAIGSTSGNISGWKNW